MIRARQVPVAVRRSVLGDAACRPRRGLPPRISTGRSSSSSPRRRGARVWARPGWTKRERSIVTLALLAALGHDEEVALHVRATANTGATREDICEAFLHVAIYAGVPARQPTPSRSPRRCSPKWTHRRKAAMAADRLSNRQPETGAFFQRDRTWHPPAFTPGYKTTVLRSPQRALLSFDNTLSEITGPVFGHGILGELDNDLIHNFAKPGESAIGERIIVYGRVLDERGKGVAGRPAGILAGQCRRPLPPQEGRLSRAARSRISAAAAAPSPTRTAAMRCAPSSPAPIPWPNGANDWRPAHIHFSVFGHGFAQRLITQMYFEGDPMIWQCPIVRIDPGPRGDRDADRRARHAGDDPDGRARLQIRHRAARPPLVAVREPAGGQLMASGPRPPQGERFADRRPLRAYRPDAEFLRHPGRLSRRSRRSDGQRQDQGRAHHACACACFDGTRHAAQGRA